MIKVLVSDKLSSKGVEVLEKAGFQVDVNTGLSHEDQLKIIQDYDAIVIRSATKVTADMIAVADKLKVIGRAGSGLDNVDIPEATKKGIIVMNTPGGNTITTAEHALSMMLSLARHIPQATMSMKAGKWEKSKFMGTELCDHVLGVVGLGNIGSIVADRAKGLGMQILVFDPFISSEKAKKLGYELATLDDLFMRSDFITIHTPKTKETQGLINTETIAKMKDGVFIINCARGGIVNELDLAEAIKKGKVAGAAVDVYITEPPEDRTLIDLDQVICTPHLGASTIEAQEKVAVAVARQIADYFLKNTVRNAVNVPTISPEDATNTAPYLNLAEAMGRFQANIITGGLKEVAIEYSGDITNYDTQPVTISFLKGLLEPILEESINFVNATHIAKERGVKIIESMASETENFTQLIKIKVTTDETESVIQGTIFGVSDPRIVKINQYELECIPSGNMLFIQNNDKPGVIGSVGKVLGDHAINIAQMQVGCDFKAAKAIMVITTDNPADDQTLNELKNIPNIVELKQFKI